MTIFETITTNKNGVESIIYNLLPNFDIVSFVSFLGQISTCLICVLTYFLLKNAQKQYDTMYNPSVFARLEHEYKNTILIVLENTGYFVAENVQVKFNDDWFAKGLEELNASDARIREMIDILTDNSHSRPIQGRSAIGYAIFKCADKNKDDINQFYERFREKEKHQFTKITITWWFNGKKNSREQVIDLMDEYVVGWQPLSRIAKALEDFHKKG